MQSSKPNPVIIWWVLWGTIVFGYIGIYMILPSGSSHEVSPTSRYFPIVPLSLSIIVRWMVLPLVLGKGAALPVFLFGLAMAETCGILAIFLVPELRLTYFVLTLVGLIQFVPIFASRQGK